MSKTWLESLGEDVIQVSLPGDKEDSETVISLVRDDDSCCCSAGRLLGDMIVHVDFPDDEMVTSMSIIEGESMYDAVLKAVQLVKNHVEAQ